MSQSYIKYLTDCNKSVGLFNESNELVARCLQIDDGSIALLHVEEGSQGKGYGEIVVRELSRQIAMERDSDVFVNVTESNEKAVEVFDNVGFKDMEITHWVGVNKKKPLGVQVYVLENLFTREIKGLSFKK